MSEMKFYVAKHEVEKPIAVFIEQSVGEPTLMMVFAAKTGKHIGNVHKDFVDVLFASIESIADADTEEDVKELLKVESSVNDLLKDVHSVSSKVEQLLGGKEKTCP